VSILKLHDDFWDIFLFCWIERVGIVMQENFNYGSGEENRIFCVYTYYIMPGLLRSHFNFPECLLFIAMFTLFSCFATLCTQHGRERHISY